MGEGIDTLITVEPKFKFWLEGIDTLLKLNRDNHERRMMQLRQALDRLGVYEFAWTPYDD
ncbi:hypothetical protein PIB30_034743 [Stylosanthes scabra]|uniref:Uncharacterized protein n=1 Tax=Stylosanthes scabra TaxID=79078 RepID=A0ABU6YA84_9FABA|nr:hypothetical protein [Stylosanthes scabra]